MRKYLSSCCSSKTLFCVSQAVSISNEKGRGNGKHTKKANKAGTNAEELFKKLGLAINSHIVEQEVT